MGRSDAKKKNSPSSPQNQVFPRERRVEGVGRRAKKILAFRERRGGRGGRSLRRQRAGCPGSEKSLTQKSCVPVRVKAKRPLRRRCVFGLCEKKEDDSRQEKKSWTSCWNKQKFCVIKRNFRVLHRSTPFLHALRKNLLLFHRSSSCLLKR